jgi:hypothetical protein
MSESLTYWGSLIRKSDEERHNFLSSGFPFCPVRKSEEAVLLLSENQMRSQ